MFKRILIVNRGEIARRIIRTCKGMGIETVAVHSDADMDAPYTREADQAVLIGLAQPYASYMNIDAVFDAALQTGVDAIHPGYGFLAGNPYFADNCAEKELVFIGPPPAVIAAMGEKVTARNIMQDMGIPVVPGTLEPASDPDEIVAQAEKIGYPVMVKPAAGSDGIGLFVAENAEKLLAGLKNTQVRAQRAFGDDSVYLEKFIPAARHIEIQLLFDQQGQGVHLYEREGSIQRRYQKIIEEAPSPVLNLQPDLRKRMVSAALQAASLIGFQGTGTMEFLVTETGEFYFLEMGTCLPVEHALTEAILGLDLVEHQLRSAAGEPLSLKQQELSPKGHAIEFRIYAEDPVTFVPQTGQISVFNPPAVSQNIRLDSGVAEGSVITSHYDPLLAKLIVWGETRDEVLERSRAALVEFKVEGIKTNIPAHLRLLEDPAFISGAYNTGILAQ